MLRKAGFCRAPSHAIFTQAETWDELRMNVLGVTSLHFEESAERPRVMQLHYVKDKLISVEAA